MSNRHRIPPPGLAARDGEVHTLRACCAVELEVCTDRLKLHHDEACPALDPDHAMADVYRIAAAIAAVDKLEELGVPVAVPLDLDGGTLIVLPKGRATT